MQTNKKTEILNGDNEIQYVQRKTIDFIKELMSEGVNPGYITMVLSREAFRVGFDCSDDPLKVFLNIMNPISSEIRYIFEEKEKSQKDSDFPVIDHSTIQ